MSINKRVLIVAEETILLFIDNVVVGFAGRVDAMFESLKKGSLYLTTHRLIFINKNPEDPVQSFFMIIGEVKLMQKVSGSTYISGKIRAQPNGDFKGEFKLTFHSGSLSEGSYGWLPQDPNFGPATTGGVLMQLSHYAQPYRAQAAQMGLNGAPQPPSYAGGFSQSPGTSYPALLPNGFNTSFQPGASASTNENPSRLIKASTDFYQSPVTPEQEAYYDPSAPNSAFVQQSQFYESPILKIRIYE